MKKTLLFGLCATALTLASCGSQPTSSLTLSGLDPAAFVAEVDGAPTALYTLTNASGMEVCITNFGGRIVSIMVPDRNGAMKDVVLGFDNIQDYIDVPSDFGAAIGRFANRIAGGVLTLGDETIQLPQNDSANTLHGGPLGWQYKVYSAEQLSESALELTLVSPDGDQNFPGTVTAKVVYTLSDDNALGIAYSATTDRTTVINMTNHSYFNLAGDPTVSATEEVLWLASDSYTPTDSALIPTGEIAPVKDTPMDFTTPKPIAQDIDKYDFEALRLGNGYDHNFVLTTAGDVSKPAARLTSPTSGISMEVFTNEPGIQVYSANFLNGTVTGKNDVVYSRRAAVCLETQHYPDSPNRPEWPTTVLEPGATYHSECIYKFSVQN
jgi:aldose 1-epimerase